MKIVYFASILASACAFAPQPTGPSHQGSILREASLQDYLGRIFPSEGAKQDAGGKVKASSTSVKSKKTSKKSMKKTDKWISDIFNNFEPVHGHGSGHAELKEIQKNQKEVLVERKSHVEKEFLKKKYRNHEVDHHGEIPMIAFDPADLNKKEDDAMFVDENYSIEVPSFHIEEAADNLMQKMNTWVSKQANSDDKLTP
mmetsp:Transcript_7888/g.19023  ORF Transcript_7888/g.19023 Transcript_7888/m.19023 type:complete len:199 (-) Transcript_7888:160-756(-)|eukprot:CAMPEP_0113621906 /NCGR_PEP_ID=MMETSP0017_2-20120614/11211_1 /TAXON_ID=2856 /ORGANISM="Cylindrotheca closterium" /LENGTH=198 /DNA_ID=CAMNT_0000531695 /DNA_START=1445 /DNA_END=2041 /DNA_ORIENTATION=+ /assembly_acc=CAM_ASM_000147